MGLNIDGKTTEDILKEMANLAGGDLRFPTFDAMKAFIQVGTVDKLCGIIGAAGGDFVKQSNALRESVGHLKDSIDDFKKSNERTSKAIIWLTVVLAIAALIQATPFIIKLFK